jgi:hypothetical protein
MADLAAAFKHGPRRNSTTTGRDIFNRLKSCSALSAGRRDRAAQTCRQDETEKLDCPLSLP